MLTRRNIGNFESHFALPRVTLESECKCLMTLSNAIFGPQYPLDDSCIVFRPERESASRIALSASVFEKIDFQKNCKFLILNIFCVNTVIVIRLLVASNYSMNTPEYNDISYYCIIIILMCLNNDQMGNDTRNAPIFEDIFQN